MKSFWCAVVVLFSSALAAHAAPANPRARFDALLAEFKTKPYEDELRKKLIAAAAALKPKPVVPKEAKRHFVMAVTFQKEAKSNADFMAAVNAYDEAITAAPWWPEAYYNSSVALEAAGRLRDAKTALEFYLLSKPKDAEAAEQRLYALDAKAAIAARAAAAPVVVERPKSPIEGSWYAGPNPAFVIERKGEGFVMRDTPNWCTSVWDISVTEDAVSFMCLVMGTTAQVRYALTRRGDELSGTTNNLGMASGRGVSAITITRR